MDNTTPGAATPERSSYNINHYATPPRPIISSASTSTPLPATPASDFACVYSAGFSLPLPHAASTASTPYNGFITADTLDDVFGTTTATPNAAFSLDMDTGLDMGLDMQMEADMDMELEMDMDLARLRAATHTGRVASLGLSSLNIDGSEDVHHDFTDVDDLFGGVYGGDATMSSPGLQSGYTYPDPVSYASMPPVSAVSSPATAMPFSLPMPAYVSSGSPCRTPLSLSQAQPHSQSQSHSQSFQAPKIDPNDWRARLRFCEQAPNKALLEAGMVRLLEFSDSMDERELAERRAANLRFDKIREQRLKDRNNEAAKRSRQRKVARIEAAEQQIASLRRERAQLVGEVATLRRRLASGSVATTAGEPTGVRKLRPTRSLAKLARREE